MLIFVSCAYKNVFSVLTSLLCEKLFQLILHSKKASAENVIKYTESKESIISSC